LKLASFVDIIQLAALRGKSLVIERQIQKECYSWRAVVFYVSGSVEFSLNNYTRSLHCQLYEEDSPAKQSHFNPNKAEDQPGFNQPIQTLSYAKKHMII